MKWLNYHHLLYFWRIATLGSISAAASELKLRQPTLSAQLKALEDQLGHKLFAREGKRLVLTEIGTITFDYAQNIFDTGRELIDVLEERPATRPIECHVGIADVVPKLLAYHLLKDVLKFPQTVKLSCHEDKPSSLLSLLATHKLDLVISDSPISSENNIKGYNHLLGESEIALFASPKLKLKHNKIAQIVNNTPLLLPLAGTALRRSIDSWCDQNSARPVIAGEFEDSALLKMFGEQGHGIFPAPIVIKREVERRYCVKCIGTLSGITEKIYAISLARKVRHPVIEQFIVNSRGILKA